MNYSDSDKGGDSGRMMIIIIILIPVLCYVFLWDYVFTEFKEGFLAFFQRIYYVNIDEAEKYSSRLGFIAASTMVLSIFLGLLLRFGKAFIVTAVIIFCSVALGLFNSYTVRDERLVSIDKDGLQKYFCTDKISGPYPVKGENCRVSKKTWLPR